MPDFPNEIAELLKKRQLLRQNKQFAEADRIRLKLDKMGYRVADQPDSGSIVQKASSNIILPHKIAVLGSWDKESIGRQAHELLIKNFPSPVRIGLIETPAGFEDNPEAHYLKLKQQLETGLVNFKPEVSLIPAYSKTEEEGTDSLNVSKQVKNIDCIHIGAGSPTYAVRQLRNSLLYATIIEQVTRGYPLSLASASAIAFGKYALPVYEIFKVGEELSWAKGLDFFSQFGLPLTFIPHWNNNQGGSEIDTSRCYIGQRRFDKLLKMLPKDTLLIGIDEHTALIFDLINREVQVLGKGNAYTNGGSKTLASGSKITFSNI